MAQWRYPKPRDGATQAQDPSDDTADGADCIAALRYAVMSQFRTPEFAVPEELHRRNVDYGLEKIIEQVKENLDG